MNRSALIDVSADLHESLRAFESERGVRDNIEDRVLAETLRKDGYDDVRLKDRFGYVPTRIEKGPRVRLLALGSEQGVKNQSAGGHERDLKAAITDPTPHREITPRGQEGLKPRKGSGAARSLKSGLG